MADRLVLRAVGDGALVADLTDLVGVRALLAAVLQSPPDGLVDVVPGACSLLVRAEPGADLAALAGALRDLARAACQSGPAAALPAAGPGGAEPGAADLVVPVRYDGPDLDEVAARTGLPVDGLVAAHTGAPWAVAFMGFAPGFGYLVGGDPRLDVPRRDHPRPVVPAGAVALAGPHSGIYPRSSPGGWQLIGRSDLRWWDLHRDPPALLTPGRRVRFVAVR